MNIIKKYFNIKSEPTPEEIEIPDGDYCTESVD